MTTLDDIDQTLPNGFHDATLIAVALDFAKHEARLKLDIWVGNLDSSDDTVREAHRPAEVVLTGLLYWVSEPPESSLSDEEPSAPRIDTGKIEELPSPPTKLPSIPSDAFRNYIYVFDWNSFIYLAARDASFSWL